MQVTGLNFYRDPGIHGFCTWNENTVSAAETDYVPASTLFSLWLSATS